jgi:hypothetical protein
MSTAQLSALRGGQVAGPLALKVAPTQAQEVPQRVTQDPGLTQKADPDDGLPADLSERKHQGEPGIVSVHHLRVLFVRPRF